MALVRNVVVDNVNESNVRGVLRRWSSDDTRRAASIPGRVRRNAQPGESKKHGLDLIEGKFLLRGQSVLMITEIEV